MRFLAAAAVTTCTLFATNAPAGADPGQPATAGLTVRTPYGAVRGVAAGGAQAFLGLPFAKPPVDALRLTAPQAPAAWSGVRDGSRQGPACLQFQPAGVRNSRPTSEDCLYLDIYRPAKIGPGSPLPVMLFYHGGGNTRGSGVLYGGQTLASRTKTIVVSTNYRLGALGFLALSQLDAENPDLKSGNFATLDQVRALKWINKSIASFGGDPHNVTIFGQSAGAQAVCDMLATPLATGLFERAIVQSFGCGTNANPASTAEALGERFAAAAGCPVTGGSVPACLRAAWAPNLVSAAQQNVVSRPMTGGGVLPEAPGTAIAAGTWNRVPMMVGGVRWEGKLFTIAQAGITADQYEQRITTQYGATAGAEILAKYPVSAYPGPFYALSAVSTDSGIACQVNSTADLVTGRTPTYRYEFDDPTSPTLDGFQPAGIDMSNAHSAELAYLFDFTLGDRPLTATQERLAHRMQDHWAAFAAHGDPRVPGGSWPAYTASSRRALVLSPGSDHLSDQTGEEHNCGFWANLSSR